MHVEPGRLVRVRQVHGDQVAIAEAVQGGRPEADIIVSVDSTVALVVQTADCAPLLMADRRTGAVAAAHAGWRGLAIRVPATAVASLAREFGSRPTDLVVAVGPAIGACCYEVGREVRERFEAAGTSSDQLARWFLPLPARLGTNPSMPRLGVPRGADRWFFDTWTVCRDQLTAAGVPNDHIFVADLCTASHASVLCSYRRDGRLAGRIAGAIRSPRLRP
jgi:YfiH family protein